MTIFSEARASSALTDIFANTEKSTIKAELDILTALDKQRQKKADKKLRGKDLALCFVVSLAESMLCQAS